MKRIIFINFHYSIEIAPSIKNAIFMLAQEGYEIDVYIDNLYRNKGFALKKGNLHILESGVGQKNKYMMFLNSLFLKLLRSQYISSLRQISFVNNYIIQYTSPGLNDFQIKLRGYDLKANWYFVSDLLSLLALYPLLDKDQRQKIIFWSLELETYFLQFEIIKDTITKMLENCTLILIQDKDRANILSNFLGFNPLYVYIPVSLLGKPIEKKGDIHRNFFGLKNSDFIVLYSGYIADWSMLDEIIESFNNWPPLCHLVIQGHLMGTESFGEKLKHMARKKSNIHFWEDFISDDNYEEFVSSADSGLAFYKPMNHNFSYVLRSSGKIATFLKCGLPVMTNIKQSYEDDMNAESIISGLKPSEIGNILNTLIANKEFYAEKAKQDFLKFYSFEKYFQDVINHISLKE